MINSEFEQATGLNTWQLKMKQNKLTQNNDAESAVQECVQSNYFDILPLILALVNMAMNLQVP
jgi:hypothetical protein